ncbi:MAG: NADH:ubiquinone oxidoreductase [Bacteroidetes bacterium]|jgi:GxxExxY protein|nr:NADH:ubiquinone oxidoreductase [Bacteroidota bacterium]
MADLNIRTEWLTEEPESKYWNKNDFLFQDETRQIIGISMEVHRVLGRGFSEIGYKDALEYELKKRGILFEREKSYKVNYKEIVLNHTFCADFVIFGNIIVEVKAKNGIVDDHSEQTINYLAVSKCPVGLLINFGESSLKFKRFALTKSIN